MGPVMLCTTAGGSPLNQSKLCALTSSVDAAFTHLLRDCREGGGGPPGGGEEAYGVIFITQDDFYYYGVIFISMG